jgi:hypothetical protein
MGFIRFVIAKPHPDSGVNNGVFEPAYRLREDPSLGQNDRRILDEVLDWFDKHLASPDRFNRSKSKGYYRRATHGITWFRDGATECISQMYRLKDVLDASGYSVTAIRSTRVGYIVYEDEFQVVAEPFSDTQTKA